MNQKNGSPYPEQKLPPKPGDLGSWVRFRLGFVYLCFVVFFGFVCFRLVQLQVLDNPDLKQLATKQFEKVGKISPHRLGLYDRNREELAVSVPASSIFARPRLMKSPRKASRVLAKVLGGTPAKWLARLDAQRPFVWIQRQVNEDVAKQLARYNLPGISIEPENRRLYPNGTLAAQVLGFTDIDGNGLAGLELSLDQELLKKESKFPLPRDGKGTPSYIDSRYAKTDDGKTGVYVTLDRRVQHVVEEELDRAMEESGPRAAFAVVMDPYTGEIFGLGERPTFDPNRASQFSSKLFTNQIVSHLYEPGSTMKVIFSAEAIERGLMTPKSMVFCENGEIAFGKKRIHEAESKHFGWLPLEKVIQYSSNIGAVKVAQTLGAERVRATLERFGLTRKTGVSLPGEVSSAQKKESFWRPIFLATVGFGQGVSVTPLQMVTAFAPLANGGYLIHPRILLRENTPHEGAEAEPILSPSTVQAMREILVGVTEQGSGTLARVPNIRVAGKTGTGQKYAGQGGYESKKYFSSFIGFLPAESPELLIGVMLDEPKAPYYGSKVAAPIFQRIAERSLQILDRVPKQVVSQAKAVSRPLPAENTKLDLVASANGKWAMPNLVGLSMREALKMVGSHVRVNVSGYGYVETQSPGPGISIAPTSQVYLHFSPSAG